MVDKIGIISVFTIAILINMTKGLQCISSVHRLCWRISLASLPEFRADSRVRVKAPEQKVM